MSKRKKYSFYAVFDIKSCATVVFENWSDVERFIKGRPHIMKGFNDRKEAEYFPNCYSDEYLFKRLTYALGYPISCWEDLM